MYDLNYFIEKFEAIPEHLWFPRAYVNPSDPECKCVLGHCGLPKHTEESHALRAIVKAAFGRDIISGINDGDDPRWPLVPGSNPKTRVLQALNEIKAKAA